MIHPIQISSKAVARLWIQQRHRGRRRAQGVCSSRSQGHRRWVVEWHPYGLSSGGILVALPMGCGKPWGFQHGFLYIYSMMTSWALFKTIMTWQFRAVAILNKYGYIGYCVCCFRFWVVVMERRVFPYECNSGKNSLKGSPMLRMWKLPWRTGLCSMTAVISHILVGYKMKVRPLQRHGLWWIQWSQPKEQSPYSKHVCYVQGVKVVSFCPGFARFSCHSCKVQLLDTKESL